MPFDLDSVRSRFPALAITDEGVPRIYLDNPAGTQVPVSVADAIADCLLYRNANLGGYFASSDAAVEVVAESRAAMADLLNAPSVDEIVFGANMTTITLHLSRSIGRLLQSGDEIILSRMDHDANVWPWVLMARDFDLEVKWLPFNRETFEFDLDDLDQWCQQPDGYDQRGCHYLQQGQARRRDDVHRRRAIGSACRHRCTATWL
jgi:selenocysteine lyase/cysteine desulfurase